ncbi:acyl-CoA thioester hydrolase [Fodinibius roseus]|uniref:Acyl-CoA thioester hydrolase n=1 Tax=Fodinibius roseus TaxID=1194090 RepID=A0A1M5GVE9_9BACT|nr:thioesterase family protein [Fodinibius roseus]SHG07667.1 acyl-CoA thioester hydrolase [Fodinibius roseus]
MKNPSYQQELFPHWSEIPIRFRDLDPLNHVNNALFNTYYEEARIKFIRQVPAFADQLQEGFSFVLANINIDFIHPAEYPGSLLIGSGIIKMGHSSISSFQAIYLAEEKTLVSVAEAHGVWFDLEQQKPSRLPGVDDADQFFVNG